MARKLALSILTFGLGLVILPVVSATQKPYVQGKFVAIHQKSRDRVDLYLVNTPITTAVPYFEITVQFGDVDYLAEYTPRHSREELPEAWRPDEALFVHAQHHLRACRMGLETTQRLSSLGAEPYSRTFGRESWS